MTDEAINRLPYGTSVPSSWKVVPLKYLTTAVNGYAFKPGDWSDSGVPIIRIENLNGSENFNFSNLQLRGRHRVSSGDLLYSWSGNPGTSFGPFRWEREGQYYLNQHIFKMQVYGCGTAWLYWALKAATQWVERELTSGIIGMVHVTKEDLLNIPIPVPPVGEQRRIADFLDAETARIDRLRSLRDSQRSLVEERLFARVSGAFSLDGSVDLVRLGYLAKVQTGITVDAARSTAGDVVTRPYLRVANVQAGYLALDSVTEITVPVRVANSSTLRPGDVLMTEGGDLDKLGRGTAWKGEIPNCLHQNHVFAVRPDHRLDPEYLALLTRTAYARKYFESTGTKSTNLASTSSSKIRDFRVPLVPIAHQKDISRRLNSELRQGESLLATLEEQQRLLEERRRAVITAAVTGELDVTTARRS